MNETTKQEINSLDIIGFLWRNKKILIIVGVLAFIVSLLFL
jgi:LPS O-antigen subunit length determinant protein (WzzB/FepE family)